MTEVLCFTFNPFEENTYVVYDASGECILVDPGCYTAAEKNHLRNSLEQRGLKPVRLINTHCHLDHVFGNRFVFDTWGLLPELHEGELPLLRRFPDTCRMYGIPGAEASPEPEVFLQPGETLAFGQSALKLLYTPGHSPASVSLYCEEAGFVLAGDVLFYESIGRTDLPGGNFDTLAHSIRSELYTLPGHTLVYAGHGPSTTIRHEMEYNPFVPA
jgi:glyoxylase-like metal-dependent hydrolase (beta-lactamase superfamily II)